MSIRTAIFAAATALAALTGAASADDLKAGSGRSIDVGALSGVAYYTVEPAGYRVVAAVARDAESPAIRFEAVLAEGQTVVLSSPQEIGRPAAAIEISRVGDRVTVQSPALY
jgi:hypothetical protein